MGSEWPIVRLADHCLKIGSGATPKGGSGVYLDKGEIYLIRSQNVYNDGFSPDGLVFITDDAADKLKNVVVEKNDILLNITGDSVARVCLAVAEYLPARVNQHVAIIRPNPKEFDARFVRYFLASPYQQALLLNLASAGATRNSLTKAMIETFEVPKPPLAVQISIADQLEGLDNKITLNRQLNQTLEQMAQALFKSWFVDFDPVIDNALAAGHPIPDDLQDRALLRQGIRQLQLALSTQKQGDHKPLPEAPAAGLPKELRKLFPSEFELTESLGWVPKGWGEVGLNKFIKFVNGKSKTSDDSGVFPLYGANGEIGRSNVEKFRNAIIIGRVGAYCGAIEFCLGGFWASDNTIVATPLIDEQSIGYVLYLLKYLELNQFAGGAAQPLLNQSVLGSIKFPDVSNEIVKLFNNISSGFLASIWQRKKEMDDLAQLRDTLLPKLISGELRIPEAQAQLEAALG